MSNVCSVYPYPEVSPEAAVEVALLGDGAGHHQLVKSRWSHALHGELLPPDTHERKASQG